MTASMDLAEAIRTAGQSATPMLTARGQVSVEGTASGAPAMARVTGVVVGDLWVPRSQWCSPFIAQAGAVRAGQAVAVLLIAGRPHILCTIGD